MNLENRINRLLEKESLKAFDSFRETRVIIINTKDGIMGELKGFDDFTPIEEWEWPSDLALESWVGHRSVNELIESADLAECLISPANYVRKYREWYESRR